MSTVAERVARGAALLDEREPGWAERIDLGRLDVMSECRCVLGQLYLREWPDLRLPYLFAVRALGIDDTQAEQALGFDDEDGEYPELTAEWHRVITARRSA
jgi:hypothetical protein